MAANTDKPAKKGTAVIIMNNEVVLGAIKNVAKDLGYEVSQSIQSCGTAEVGFVGSYFALLGVLKHVRFLCSTLPLVLVQNDDYLMSTESSSPKEFFDVITLESNNNADIEKKIRLWFSEGRGRYLRQGRGSSCGLKEERCNGLKK